jgi:hypothetical protein
MLLSWLAGHGVTDVAAMIAAVIGVVERYSRYR